MLEKMSTKTNKKNLLKLLIFSFIFFVILAPRIYANGDETPELEIQIKPEDTHIYQKDDWEISFGMWATFNLNEVIEESNKRHNLNLRLVS